MIEAIHHKCIPIVSNNGNLACVIQNNYNGFYVHSKSQLEKCLLYCTRHYKEIYSQFETSLNYMRLLYNQEIYELMVSKLVSLEYNRDEYIFWNHIFVHFKKIISKADKTSTRKDGDLDYCIISKKDGMEAFISAVIAWFYTGFPIVNQDSHSFFGKLKDQFQFMFSESDYRKVLYVDSGSFLLSNFDYFIQFDYLSANGIEWKANDIDSENQKIFASPETIKLFESITVSTQNIVDTKSLHRKFIKLYES